MASSISRDGREGGATTLPGALADFRAAPRTALAAAVVLVALVWIAFRGCLDNGFVNYDDPVYVTSNRHLVGFSAENLRWMLTDAHTFYWHPLAYLWHAAEIRAFGLDPARHHLTSILLHAAGALALGAAALAVLRLTGAARGAEESAEDRLLLAAGATLLFAVHPLRVESVAWASQKKDLLSALLYAGALLAWLHRAAAPGDRARRRRGALVLALLALGLLVKPMAMTLPAAFLLLDAYPLGRLRRAADLVPLLREKLPQALLVVLALLPSLAAPRQAELLPRGDAQALPERAAAVAHAVAFPLAKTAAPTDLVAYIPAAAPGEASLAEWPWSGAALLLGGVTVACGVLALRGTRAPLAAWLFYLLAVAPVSGVRQAGALATADRYSLVPTMALVPLAAAGGLALLAWARRGPPLAPVATGIVLAGAILGAAVLLRSATARQVEVWRDSESLWAPVVARHGDRSPAPRVNLALAIADRSLRTGDRALLDHAIAQLARAEALHPGDRLVITNRGVFEMKAGRPARAEGWLRRAEMMDPSNATVQAYLAGADAELGRIDAAAERLARAERLESPPPADLVEFVRGRIAAARARGAGTVPGGAR